MAHIVKKKKPLKPRPKYHDPLHVPSAKLVVMHKGQEAIMLNKSLIDRQNCWGNLEAIKAAHSRKLQVYDAINATEDPVLLKIYGRQLSQIEFELQQLWKFTQDANFHRIWEYPKCKCPQLDNRDRYPNGHIISLVCPLHGVDKDVVVEKSIWDDENLTFIQKLMLWFESL